MRVACIWFEEPTAVQKVAENCLRFSPQICVRKDHAVFVEIGKCHRLYTEPGFLARLQVVLRRMQVHGAIAIGHDIVDSLLMAKFGVSDVFNLPLEALLDISDPFNKDPVLQKYVTKIIHAFADLGVPTLRRFKDLPTAEISSRFGAAGILCKQRLLGEHAIPWPYWRPDEIISERFAFPYFEFYGELEPIVFELKKQLDLIFQRLWARALRAQCMEIRIFCETNSRNPDRVRSFKFDFLLPQSATKGALNIIRERLSREFDKRPITTPIEGLETTVTALAPGGMGQRDFLSNQEETAEQLSSLLNQLAESCGRNNVFKAELTEDRRPEHGWVKSFEIADGRSRAKTAARLPTRPTYLMRPERIEVTEGQVFIRKKPFKIQNWTGAVERITGGWLEDDVDLFKLSYDRNYFQIELESGTVISIFQTANQTFYLHGYFG